MAEMNEDVVLKCKKVTVVQKMKNGILSTNNLPSQFLYGDFEITVEDYCVRYIIVTSKSATDVDKMLDVFLKINQICIICEGAFLDIISVCFDDKEQLYLSKLENCIAHIEKYGDGKNES